MWSSGSPGARPVASFRSAKSTCSGVRAEMTFTGRKETETVPDKELLLRHAQGDPHAFSELVARHRDRMWAVALRTIGDPEEAADALQDAFLSAYRAADRFRGDAAVTTWL